MVVVFGRSAVECGGWRVQYVLVLTYETRPFDFFITPTWRHETITIRNVTSGYDQKLDESNDGGDFA